MPPEVMVNLHPFGSFPLDLFFFLAASAFIWLIDLAINLALSYALLRFIFGYRNTARTILAAFI